MNQDIVKNIKNVIFMYQLMIKRKKSLEKDMIMIMIMMKSMITNKIIWIKKGTNEIRYC